MNAFQDTAIRPGEPGYDEQRLGFSRSAPQRPAAVVAASTADDVVAGVRLARAEDRRVAVQATGHGVGAVDPEAVLITTGGLRGIEIDPATRVARVEAGVRGGELTAAAAEHGLAPLGGSSPDVGVVGYVLHGGLPLLGRAHGWAADRLLAVERVTADGELRRVDLARSSSAAHGAVDRDLAWALAGGGGSFGVVVAIEIGLIELTHVYGGQLVFAADDAPRLLRAWRDWAATVSDAMGTGISVAPVPDVDGPPPVLRGRTVVAVQIAFDGPAAEGERLVAPLRALGEPLLDSLAWMPWTAYAAIHGEPRDPTRSVTTNVALRDLSDAAIDAGLTGVPGGRPRVFSVRRLGGALANGNGPVRGIEHGSGARMSASPVRRDAEWLAGTVAIVPPPAGEDAAVAAADHVATWNRAMAPFAAGRLANFLFGDGADPEAVRAAYAPADFDRLRAVKRAVDPDGVILAGAPIPPA